MNTVSSDILLLHAYINSVDQKKLHGEILQMITARIRKHKMTQGWNYMGKKLQKEEKKTKFM